MDPLRRSRRKRRNAPLSQTREQRAPRNSQAPPPGQVDLQRTELPHEGASAPRLVDSWPLRRNPRKGGKVPLSEDPPTAGPPVLRLRVSPGSPGRRPHPYRTGCSGSSLLQTLPNASPEPQNCWCNIAGGF
ncbi:hypothetical protein ACRRTK_009064 [Alexandromys fortis]